MSYVFTKSDILHLNNGITFHCDHLCHAFNNMLRDQQHRFGPNLSADLDVLVYGYFY